MNYSIGIDTGGTYTDIVLYDYSAKSVLAKGKTLTTKEDLSIGIKNALDLLPEDLLKKAELLSLSTTLATNACVEHKGGRAKLILMGTTRRVLEWIDAKNTYGLNHDDVLCLDTQNSFDGRVVNHPDWESIMHEHKDWFNEAQAFATAEVNAPRNGAVCEKKALEDITATYDVPFVAAYEFAQDLNVMERGATALLNARLLPVIEEFMRSVKSALEQKGLDIKTMIVRSDGSLMTDKIAHTKPVKTILSGPAASVIGAMGLVDCEQSLIVDIGGTTTDISIVENHRPVMTNSIEIGGWKTQISGVYIDTFGLGGDSRIYVKDAKINLDNRRVQPLCVLSSYYPDVVKSLQKLIDSERVSLSPLHEFLYLVRTPSDLSTYTEHERDIINRLSVSPIMFGDNYVDMYNLKIKRLEDEGVIMRAGLTPTDIMHIKGDFSAHSKDASILGARFMLNVLPDYDDSAEDLERFCDDIYDAVCKKLYSNLVRVMLSHQHKNLYQKNSNEQLDELIHLSWENKKNGAPSLVDFAFTTKAKLIGIGAPTHIFLPTVAKALGSECIIPKHAEVANAFGAVIADIFATSKVTITPTYAGDELFGYKVYTDSGLTVFEEHEQAVAFAEKAVAQQALDEARKLGAIGEITVTTDSESNDSLSKDGIKVELGDCITAVACGRIV